ncbi:acyl-CoA dehydrogenase family protein [Novosphingobium sp. Fuku2-ISO-50]|uniref:acyl-CoA dehydrogenase family protein n=1 Tax=Novosphingobium sp. Fuku2-ISO-50 TaxID=1739114 RepID=UPI00076CD30C|nr:acyl-CoA dehydrogenase family protein [Novosphingobium sp. Fuku2-ISO-50]KUR73253.1 butyryl-CoA dehydrogenase [Novosphingobium sp. Fuku2-ISO-50]
MDYSFTEEQRMWRDVVNDFMDREFGRDLTLKHDLAREFPEELYRKMAKEGWLGLLIPEDQGGLGMDKDPVMFAIFCEAIGKFSLDTAACIMTSMFTATNVARHGTAEQRKRYLEPFLAGEAKFSISISEPQSGSDAAGAKSTARLDGDEWVVKGNKVWCSGAHHPGTCIAMMLRTGSARYDFSVLLIPNDTPGLEIQKMDTLVRRSLGTTSLFMDDLRLPRDALLGEVGQGWKYIGEHLSLERLSIAASQIGNARTAHEDTIKYLSEREAFGKKLVQFQVLKHRIAEDRARLSAATYLVYAAACALARGEEASGLVAQAKLIASQTAFDIATNGMQALGGYAQLPEYHMERYFREAKHGMVGGGTNEILRSIIAKSIGL